jgi:hypothetical protein
MRDHHLIAGNFLTVGKLVGKKMRRKAHFLLGRWRAKRYQIANRLNSQEQADQALGAQFIILNVETSSRTESFLDLYF